MESLIERLNEQKMILQKITAQRQELEKLNKVKERELQAAKERNRAPEFRNEAQAFRILQCEEIHKQKIAEIETLQNQLEGLALLQAKDKQKVRLQAHQTIMKDLAQKFQSGPQTYMNQTEMTGKLSHLEKEHQMIQQNVASVNQEKARKKAIFLQRYHSNNIDSNRTTVDGNIGIVMQKICKQKKLELKQSKAKELELQKKLNNLQQLNLMLQADHARLEAKMADLNVA